MKPTYNSTDSLPESWSVVPLAELLSAGPKNGYSGPSAKGAQGTPTLSLGATTSGRLVLNEDTVKHLVETIDPNSDLLLRSGDVLVQRSNTSDLVGMTAIFDGPAGVFAYPDLMMKLRFRHRETAHWFWRCANSSLGRKFFSSTAAGSSGSMPKISGKQLRAMQIPLPPNSEQHAVAETFSDVDALLEGLDRLIVKNRDLKQAAMQQLLTGRTRLPGFEGGWSMQPFSKVLDRLNAKRHQIQVSEYQSTGTHPVVDQGKEPIVGYSDHADRRLRCPKGGVIVFGDHTCIVKFVDFDFLVGADGTQVLASRPGQSARFHAYQLQHAGIESTGYNRHYGHLKNRSFVVPPFAEQTAIAGVLSGMDAELKGLELRRQKTRALKQAMMQELLTGRIRLI